MATKGVIYDEGVNNAQALRWIKERHTHISLNEPNDEVVSKLINRFIELLPEMEKSHKLFAIIKKSLTPKQTELIIDNIDLK